jgi:hypothetical protein
MADSILVGLSANDPRSKLVETADRAAIATQLLKCVRSCLLNNLLKPADRYRFDAKLSVRRGKPSLGQARNLS